MSDEPKVSRTDPVAVIGRSVAELADRVDELNVQVLLLLGSVFMLSILIGGLTWRLSRV